MTTPNPSSGVQELGGNDSVESLGLSGTTLMQLWGIGVSSISDLTTLTTDSLRKRLSESLNGSAGARERVEKTMTDIQSVMRIPQAPEVAVKEKEETKTETEGDRITSEEEAPVKRRDRLELEPDPDHDLLDKANAAVPKLPNDTLAVFYRDMRKYKVLSREQHTELGRRVLEEKDEEARNKLVSHNLRLVLWVARKQLWATIARKKEWSALEFADLVQEGSLGLMIAADKWDYRKGFSFSTYAQWWVRQTISRAIQNSGFIRIPVHLEELLYKVRRAMNEIAAREGRPPSIPEIATAVEVTPGRVRSVLKLTRMAVVTLNQPDPGIENRVNPGYWEPEEWLTTMSDAGALNPETLLQAKQELDAACGRLNTLTEVLYNDETISERNRDMFVHFYGLDGALQKRTLEHVSENLEMTRERVRQIIASIWEKLQRIGLDMDHETVLADLARIGELEKLADRLVGVD